MNALDQKLNELLAGCNEDAFAAGIQRVKDALVPLQSTRKRM